MSKAIVVISVLLLTMGAASAQTDFFKGGENSLRTEREKKDAGAIDRAYQSTIKRLPDAEKKKSYPWGDVRAAPPSAAKNKQQ